MCGSMSILRPSQVGNNSSLKKLAARVFLNKLVLTVPLNIDFDSVSEDVGS